jgi:hypothetical protein
MIENDQGRPLPAERPKSASLVDIFSGSEAQAMVLKALLDSLGFDVILNEQFLRATDPSLAGKLLFDVDLRVPSSQAAAALVAIAECRSEAAVGHGEDETAGDEEPEEGDGDGAGEDDSGDDEEWEEELPVSVDRLAYRTRVWAALLLSPGLACSLLSPLLGALVLIGCCILAATYTAQVNALGVAPGTHKLTGLTLLAVILILLAAVVVKLSLPPD